MKVSSEISIDLPPTQCFVLNHSGDEIRWKRFIEENQWQAHAGRLKRVRVINPSLVRPPRRWQGSSYEWARLRGLLQVFESCLNQRIPFGMIVDDGARLVPNGRLKFEQFVQELPVDWQLFALGGEHQFIVQGVPTQVSENVYRPFSIAAPIAVCWRGFPMLRRLYDFCLKSCTSAVGPRDYCEIKRPDSRCIYVPGEWIFRIADSQHTQRRNSFAGGAGSLWNVQWPQTVVAVLAHYRGGSSCVAGVLHKLGVSMGESMLEPDPINPHGYFECLRLHRLSHRCFDHPSLARKRSSSQITGLLRQWAYQRSLADPQSTHFGGKHPVLCCLGDEMRTAWPKRSYVVVDRDHSNIVASILRTGWGWSRHEAGIAVATVDEHREQLLSKCDESEYLRISYEELRENPEHVIGRIIEQLAIQIDPMKRNAAVAHVKR